MITIYDTQTMLDLSQCFLFVWSIPSHCHAFFPFPSQPFPSLFSSFFTTSDDDDDGGREDNDLRCRWRKSNVYNGGGAPSDMDCCT